MQKHIGKKRLVSKQAAKLVNAPAQRPRFKHEQLPDKFTYALAACTAERRKDGWYVAKTVTSFAGEKPRWSGPFETIETASVRCGALSRQQLGVDRPCSGHPPGRLAGA
jgi:hypothetical protein